MGMKHFRATPLPNPPAKYESQFMLQIIRNLEQYFSRIDSKAPWVMDYLEVGYLQGALTQATTQYADVYSMLGQGATLANIPEVVVLDTARAISERIDFDNNTLTFADAGVFKISGVVGVANSEVGDEGVELEVTVDGVPVLSRSFVVGGNETKVLNLDGAVNIPAGGEVQFTFATTSAIDTSISQAQLICTWLSYS